MESTTNSETGGGLGAARGNAERRYDAVVRLSEVLSQCRDPEDLTTILPEQLRGCLDFQRFHIVIYKENSDEVVWALLGREKSLVMAYTDVPVRERPSWQAYATQEPFHVSDLQTDERIPESLKKGIADVGLDIGPLVFVPLTTAYRRLGALGVSGPRGSAYSSEDVGFLRLVGRVVAPAISDIFNLWHAQAALEELRCQNERLQRAEQELSAVIHAIPAHVWSALPNGAIDFVNQQWEQFTGLPPEDALEWKWEAVIHPDDRARFAADWRAALGTGQALETEVRARHVDGEYRCLLVRMVPLRDESGTILKWYGSGLDIEDRKRAQSLLAGQKRVLEMVGTGEALPKILDTLCHFVEEQASGVVASILLLEGNRLRHGAAPSLPQAYTDAIDGAPIGPVAGSCGTAAYRGERVIVEDIATDPLWADYRALALPWSLRACWSTPVFSSQGKVIATFAMYYREPRTPTARDQEIIEQITYLAGVAIERSLTQEKLQQSQAYLEEAQRLTQTGSCAIDGATRETIYWSDEMFRLFGFDPGQGLPTWEAWLERVHPDDRDKVKRAGEATFREKVNCDVEFRVVRPDGSVEHIHGIGHPVLNSDEELVQVVGTMVDITARKRADEARDRLRRAEAELAHINRVSTMGELTASLAHEIKQPIGAAVTNAEACLRLLDRSRPDLSEAREAAQDMVRDARRSAAIIDRVRALYQKDSSHYALVDLNDLIREMVVVLQNEAGRHSIAIHTDLAEGLPAAMADRVQLQQVLMNLMLNGMEAIRGPAGQLRIQSRLGEDDQVEISIIDNGIGLPAEATEKMFDAFFTTKSQGTGLGLAITRSIVESHGGRVWAAANAERGATFRFTVPIGTALPA
jgi:PAS domain S-box-containing protein